MNAAAEIRLLERAAGDAEAVWRLARGLRGIEYELGGTAIDVFARLIADEPQVTRLVNRMADAHHLMITGRNNAYTLASMVEVWNDWQKVQTSLRAAGRSDVPQLIRAVDQHLGARLAFGYDTVTDLAVRAAAPVTSAAVKRTAVAGSRLVEEASVIAARSGAREAWLKAATYLTHDDPAWTQIAELIAERTKGAVTPDSAKGLVSAVQGKLGEHLAMRMATDVQMMDDAYKRALAIAAERAGEGWSVRVCDGIARASTVKGGIAEFYDVSIWLVKETPERLAMPVQIIQVKAGTVRDALAQMGTDLEREIAGIGREAAEKAPTVELAEAGGKQTYRFTPPQEFETHRVLVAPRPPSEARLLADLPPGIAVDYVQLPLTKREMRELSKAVTSAGSAKVAVLKL